MTLLDNAQQQQSEDQGNGKSGQLLALALFIMLLAFFIVMNAISNFEEDKVDPIMESIGKTFGSHYDQLLAQKVQSGDMPSETAHEDRSSGQGSALERLQAMFNAELTGYEAQINDIRGELYLKVPYDVFDEMLDGETFAARVASGETQPPEISTADEDEEGARQDFAPTFAAFMKRKYEGRPYQVAVVLNVDASPAQLANENPVLLKDYFDKVSSLTARLEKAGIPKHLLHANISDSGGEHLSGDDNSYFVELFFSRYVPLVSEQSMNERGGR